MRRLISTKRRPFPLRLKNKVAAAVSLWPPMTKSTRAFANIAPPRPASSLLPPPSRHQAASLPDVLLRRTRSPISRGVASTLVKPRGRLFSQHRRHISRCVVLPATPCVRLVCLAGCGSNTLKTGSVFPPQTWSPSNAPIVDSFSGFSDLWHFTFQLLNVGFYIVFGAPLRPSGH